MSEPPSRLVLGVLDPAAQRAVLARHFSRLSPRVLALALLIAASVAGAAAEATKWTPAEFERVLHPVFEEDELTLVIVGAVLGGAVGWAQAWWDARSKRLDAESRGRPPTGLAP